MTEHVRERPPGRHLVFLVAVIAALAWLPTWDAPYAEDDWLFLEAVRVTDPPHLAGYLTGEGVMDHHYRPLSDPLFFALTNAIFGLSPIGYHVLLLILHVTSAGFVGMIGRRVGLTASASLLAALLYVTRDFAFPSLSWGSGISDVGSACFLLGAVTLFLHGLSHPGRAGRVMSVVLFVLALLTKETAIVGVGLFVLAAAFHRVRHTNSRRPAATVRKVGAPVPREESWSRFLLRTTGPLVAVGVPVAVVQLSIARFAEAGGQHLYALELSGHALRIWPAYLAWTLVGVKEMWAIPAVAITISVAAYGMLIAVGVTAIRFVESRRSLVAAAFGIGWFFVAISPALLAPNRILTNYLAIAGVGPLLVLAGAISSGLRFPSRGMRLTVATLTVLLLAAGPVLIRAKDRGYLATGGWVDVQKARLLDGTANAVAQEVLPVPAPGATLIVFGALLYDVRVLGDPDRAGFGPRQVLASALRVRYGRSDLEVISLPPVGATPPEAFRVVHTVLNRQPGTTHVLLTHPGSAGAPRVEDRTAAARAVLSRGGSTVDLRRALSDF